MIFVVVVVFCCFVLAFVCLFCCCCCLVFRLFGCSHFFYFFLFSFLAFSPCSYSSRLIRFCFGVVAMLVLRSSIFLLETFVAVKVDRQ